MTVRVCSSCRGPLPEESRKRRLCDGCQQPGKTAADMAAEARAWADRQPLTVTCLFCGWRHIGLAADSRDAARRHREREHPAAARARTRRKPAVIGHPGAKLTEDQYQEAAQARAERDDAQRLARIEAGRARRDREEAA